MLLGRGFPHWMGGALCVLLATVLGLWCASAQVRAQGVSRQVVLRAGDLLQEDPEFQETLRELLSRVDLELVSLTRAREERVLWRVDVDTSERGAVLTLRNAETGTRVRRTVERAETQALFRETLAHVILGVIEPSASDGESEPDAQAAEPAAKAAPAQPEPARELPSMLSSPRVDTEGKASQRRRERPGLGLFAHGGPLLVETDRLAARLSGGAILRFAARSTPSLGLEAGGLWPVGVDERAVKGKVSLLSLRLLAGLRLFGRPRGALDLQLAPGVDLLSLSTDAAARAVEREPRARRVQPLVGGRLLGSVRVSRYVALTLGAGLDVDLAPRRWVLDAQREAVTMFETARFRPYAFVGVDVALLADPARAP